MTVEADVGDDLAQCADSRPHAVRYERARRVDDVDGVGAVPGHQRCMRRQSLGLEHVAHHQEGAERLSHCGMLRVDGNVTEQVDRHTILAGVRVSEAVLSSRELAFVAHRRRVVGGAPSLAASARDRRLCGSLPRPIAFTPAR